MVVVLVGYASAAIIALIILAVGILLGVVTLGGLSRTVFGVGYSSLGLALSIFTLFVSYGSKLVVSFLVGKLILERLVPQASKQNIWPMLLGVVLYVVFRSIPWFGWLIGVVVTLIGLGAVFLVIREKRLALYTETT